MFGVCIRVCLRVRARACVCVCVCVCVRACVRVCIIVYRLVVFAACTIVKSALILSIYPSVYLQCLVALKPTGMICSGGENVCLWDYSGKLLSSCKRSSLAERDYSMLCVLTSAIMCYVYLSYNSSTHFIS